MLSVGFLFMLVQNYSYMRIPIHMKNILDEIGGQNRSSLVYHNLLLILLFTAVMAVSLYYMRDIIIGISRKIEYELREALYHKLLSLDYLFYQKNETGDLISRTTNDLTSVRTLLGPGVMYIPNSLSRLIFFLPILIRLSGYLVFLISLVMALLVIAIIKLLPLLRPMFLKIQEFMGMMNNRVWQVISGINSIKQFTAESIEINRFKTLNNEYIKKQMEVVKLQEILRPLFVFLFSITELVILLVGGKQVIRGQMTIGELLQFNIMIASLTFPILALGWMMSLIQQGISAMARINYIFHEPVEDPQSKEHLCTSEPHIELKHLTYHYPGHEQIVLNDINLTVETGQITGITGPVGSGKSTLINILNGLLKPDPGQVFVNGTDITQINLEDFYRHVSVVSQDPFLFSKSARDNIALGPEDMTEQDIKIAAEHSGLTSEINTFPNGFDQMIGERGITLSGGQKQRMAIARALGKSAPILVMDDPLSNVDSRTEEHILAHLKNHHRFKTLILVSHRISVLKIAHNIIVLNEGQIVEKGNHTQLMKQNGLYAKLGKLQQMEEPEEIIEIDAPPTQEIEPETTQNG